MTRNPIVPLLAAAVTALGAGTATAQDRPRAVIELFTSQGCSSCPPADALLARYAADPGVIALSYSVQVWDYLGWRDTLATPENTRRQAAYAQARGDRGIYTPQAVVNGLAHAVGSDPAQIEDRIRGAPRPDGLEPLSVPVTLRRDGGRVTASVAAWQGSGQPAGRLLFAVVARERAVAIARGENRGRQVVYHNVVGSLHDGGAWNGTAATFSLDLPDAAGDAAVAVLLQAATRRGGPGAILGAAMLR